MFRLKIHSVTSWQSAPHVKCSACKMLRMLKCNANFLRGMTVTRLINLSSQPFETNYFECFFSFFSSKFIFILVPFRFKKVPIDLICFEVVACETFFNCNTFIFARGTMGAAWKRMIDRHPPTNPHQPQLFWGCAKQSLKPALVPIHPFNCPL